MPRSVPSTSRRYRSFSPSSISQSVITILQIDITCQEENCRVGLLACHVLLVRRPGVRIPIQKPVEPIALPIQAFHQMLRLPRSRQVVILARKNHHLSIHAVVLQRAEPLLALLQRHAIIVVRMQNQRRRLDVLGVLQRRRVPVLVELVKQESLEVFLVPVGAVARAVVADEIGDAAQRHRGLESRGVAQNPVGHIAAVTSAGHAQPLGVHPRILFERRIHARHHVLIVHAAPIVRDAPLELLPVAGRSARIAEKNRPPLGRVDLELLIPIHAVLARRPAVNAHHHGILLARLPADRLHEKSIDVPPVRALITQAFHGGHVQSRPEIRIQVRQLALARAVQGRRIKVVQVLEIVSQVSHHAGLLVDVEAANGALSGGHGRKLVAVRIHAENVRLALHAGLEAQFARPRSPMQVGGDQVQVFQHQARFAARRRSDVQLRKLPPLRLAGECDLPAVGRPPRLRIVKVMIRNLGERPALGRNHQDIFVTPIVVLFAGAVGDKRNPRGIGRPLRIGIVPIVARRDLPARAGHGIDHPEMAALVVEPAGVVELVGDVRIMAHVALSRRGRHVIAGAGPAQHRQTFAVGRPLKRSRPVLQMCQRQSLAAIQMQNVNLHLNGGEALALTHLKNGAGAFQWSPDGKRLAVLSRTGPSDNVAAAARKSDVRHYSHISYKFNDTGWFDDKRSHLWVIDAVTGAGRQITSGDDWNDTDPQWSPDSTRIAFVSDRTGKEYDDGRNKDVWVIAAEGGPPTKISDHEFDDTQPRWSPDGRQIAFAGQTQRRQFPKLYIAAAAGGKSSLVLEDLDLIPTDLHWGPGARELRFETGVKGQTHVFRVDPDSHKFAPVTSGERAVRGFDINQKAGVMTYLANDFQHLDDLYAAALDGAGERQLTHLNADLWPGLDVAAVERLRYKSTDGWDIDGFFVKPIGWQAGKKYPMVVSVHGGPAGQYGVDWYQEFQVYAAKGWAVFFCNPRIYRLRAEVRAGHREQLGR